MCCCLQIGAVIFKKVVLAFGQGTFILPAASLPLMTSFSSGDSGVEHCHLLYLCLLPVQEVAGNFLQLQHVKDSSAVVPFIKERMGQAASGF